MGWEVVSSEGEEGVGVGRPGCGLLPVCTATHSVCVISACVCPCAYSHVWVRRPEIETECFAMALHQAFGDGVSHWTWSSPILLNRLPATLALPTAASLILESQVLGALWLLAWV